jgi:hypothetical protein
LANLYHLSFIFGGVPKIRDLEPAFSDGGDDWVRLSPFTWLLWSPKETIAVYNKIKPLLDHTDQFFISRVDTTQSIGFLAPWVWDWVNRKMPSSIVTGDPLKKLLLPPPY